MEVHHLPQNGFVLPPFAHHHYNFPTHPVELNSMIYPADLIKVVCILIPEYCNQFYEMLSGFLAQSLENLLLNQEFWLNTLDHEGSGIEVSIKEETLNLMYKGFLMQEGNTGYTSHLLKGES